MGTSTISSCGGSAILIEFCNPNIAVNRSTPYVDFDEVILVLRLFSFSFFIFQVSLLTALEETPLVFLFP